MRGWMTLAGCSALAAGIGGGAAASATGQELWRIWQEASAQTGFSLTPGDVTRSGDSLTIRDLAYLMEGSQGDFYGIIDEVTILDRRDGSVEISLSSSHDLTVEFKGPNGVAAATVQLGAFHEGLSMIASGGEDMLVVDILVPNISFEGRELELDDETLDLDFDHIVVEDAVVRFEYELVANKAATVSTHLNAENVSFSLVLDDENNGWSADFEFELEGLDRDLRAEPGIFGDMAAIEKNLMTGGTYEVGLAFRKSRMELGLSGNEGGIKIGIGSGGGNFESRTAEFGSVQGTSIIEGVFANFSAESGAPPSSPEISLKVDEFAGELRIPMLAREEPQDFRLNFDIAGLSFAETFWEMFDPGRQLPRAPAALSLALSGKASLLESLSAPEWQDPERLAQNLESGAFPVELRSLDIDNLLVSGAGAKLTGTGAFAFDGENIETVVGIPAADGQIDLKASGVQELIDNLVAAGLLSNEQEMTAGALVLMFARRDEESDTLRSTIEVRPGGSVLVNGLPLPGIIEQ